MTFGERIIFYRTAAKMTQRKLAEKMGVSATRLNYYEKDKREPDVHMIKVMADALGISSDELLGLEIPADDSLTLSREEMDLVDAFRDLDVWGKMAVQAVLDIEKKRCSQ